MRWFDMVVGVSGVLMLQPSSLHLSPQQCLCESSGRPAVSVSQYDRHSRGTLNTFKTYGGHLDRSYQHTEISCEALIKQNVREGTPE